MCICDIAIFVLFSWSFAFQNLIIKYIFIYKTTKTLHSYVIILFLSLVFFFKTSSVIIIIFYYIKTKQIYINIYVFIFIRFLFALIGIFFQILYLSVNSFSNFRSHLVFQFSLNGQMSIKLLCYPYGHIWICLYK